jgi:hypothetical protein
MTSAGNRHTATITIKPSGAGSMNIPKPVLEALDTGDDGGTIVIITHDDGTAHLVPLEQVLLEGH